MTELLNRLYLDAANRCMAAQTNEAWTFERFFCAVIVEECIKVLDTHDYTSDTLKTHFGIQ